MLIYLAGPFRANQGGTVEENIAAAEAVATQLWKWGHAVICPHANTRFLHHEPPTDPAAPVAVERILEGDMMMLERCDAMVVLPGWRYSAGTQAEMEHAKSIGLPIYFWYGHFGSPTMMDTAEKLNCPHPTEQRCPEQCRAFAQELGRMYRLHLSKNADYSPANIAGPGDVGIAVRIWDKCARLMNLLGFRIEVTRSAEPIIPRNPQHEGIEDTYRDLAVYGVIGQLFRQGKWGK